MVVQPGGLLSGDAALLHLGRVCVLGLEDDGPASLEGALVIRLRGLLVVRDEFPVAEVFGGPHGLRRLLNYGLAPLLVVAEGEVDVLLEAFALRPAHGPLVLLHRVFLVGCRSVRSLHGLSPSFGFSVV